MFTRAASRCLNCGCLFQPSTRFFSNAPKRGASGMRLDIRALADSPRTGVSMLGMYRMASSAQDYTKLIGAQFLHNELPIRLARCLRQLYDLPYDMSRLPGVKTVCDLYEACFDSIWNLESPKRTEDAELMTKVLRKHLYNPGHDTVFLISSSIMHVRENIFMLEPSESTRRYEIELLKQFIDDFYIGRIGMRMLVAQQIALYDGPDDFVGIIDGQCNPIDIVNLAVNDAKAVCESTYHISPHVEVVRRVEGGVQEGKDTFTYIPGHLHNMVFELLKNAMRATVEFTRKTKTECTSEDLGPIKAVASIGDEEVTVKISDRGGGISRQEMDEIMTYTYSTAPLPKEIPAMVRPQKDDLPLKGLVHAPMAGFGYGLPLTKLYARYSGGDLEILSMDGYGTDAFLYLAMDEQEELMDS